MLRYVLRRVLIAIPVLFGIVFISFVILRMLPADPARMMMSAGEFAAPPEYIAQRRAELGLDGSTAEQFVAWIREILSGNLGYSFSRRLPVSGLIVEKLWPTLLLTGSGIILALVIGIPLGVLAAIKQNSTFDYLSSTGSMLAISVPSFFLGLLAIWVFSVILRVLPSAGMRSLSGSGSFFDTAQHLILPAGVLTVLLVGPYVRYVRQSMLEVMRQDYITTARAKGVPWHRVVLSHGLRNALVPLTTVVAIQVPSLLGGVLIIEVIFSWPGLGRLAFSAITAADYPVIIALILLSAILVMLFNLVADVVVAVLDPRIRL